MDNILSYIKDNNLSRYLLNNNSYNEKLSFYPKPNSLLNPDDFTKEFQLKDEEKEILEFSYSKKINNKLNFSKFENPKYNFNKFFNHINQSKVKINKINEKIKNLNPNELMVNLIKDFKENNFDNKIKEDLTIKDIKNKKYFN